jgi:hypothetical protein
LLAGAAIMAEIRLADKVSRIANRLICFAV